jgi:hypothetical protein
MERNKVNLLTSWRGEFPANLIVVQIVKIHETGEA